MSEIKTIASLGALPPGKRLIEYTHEYTKTYYNTYYQVVDEARADELEEQLGTYGFCDFDYGDTKHDQAQWLGDQQEPSYDSEETSEEFNGVELLQATVKYDPSDEDQRYAVERGWEEHINERDYNTVKRTQGAQG